MVQFIVSWLWQFQGLHTDVVQGFVVDTEGLVSVLNQLVNRQGSVVWFDNGVGGLWRWDNGESGHHSIWELFSQFGDQQGTHTGPGTTTQGMCDLETLQRVTTFGLSSYNVQDRVDQFSTFGVMTFGPNVTSRGLTVDEVIWSEQVTVTR